MRCRDRIVLLVCALASLVLVTKAAFARDDAASAEALSHFKRGNEYYKGALYDSALIEYRASYERNADPLLLFNIAQTYRQMGEKRRALEHYQRFLEVRPNGRGSDEARKYSASLTAEIGDDERSREHAKPPEKVVVVDPVPSLSVDPATQAPSRAPLYIAVAGATLALTGAVLLVTVSSGVHDVEAMGCSPMCNPQLLSGLEARATVGYVFTALGGAAAIGGLTWWLLRHESRSASRRAFVLPTLGGIAAGGAF